MAYMDQVKKKQLAPAIKKVLKKYGMKGTISVRNYMTLAVNIKEGPIDFGLNKLWFQHINTYYIDKWHTGAAKNFLTELLNAMKGTTWYDSSDAMIDHFDTAYYTDINIGQWDNPYKLVALNTSANIS